MAETAVLPRNEVQSSVPAVEQAPVLEQQAVAVELASVRVRRAPGALAAELLHVVEVLAAARVPGVAQAGAQAHAAAAWAAAQERYAMWVLEPAHGAALEPVLSPAVALERAELQCEGAQLAAFPDEPRAAAEDVFPALA